MENYNVSLIFSADWGVEVQANSPEEAAEKAYNSDEASSSVCHQCAGNINIGDCIRVIVYDESGEEVLDDGVDSLLCAQIAELKAENERLKTVPMKYRRMEFNAQLQKENDELKRQRDEYKADAERCGNKADDLAIGTKLFTEAQLTASYEQGKRDAIPEGYVIVPKEPTHEMLTYIQGLIAPGIDTRIDAYKAMIAAAQK